MTRAFNYPLSIPPLEAPLVTPNGRTTSEWRRWFEGVQIQAGGQGGDELFVVQNDVDDLQATRLVTAEAGASFAGIEIVARDSGGNLTSDLRFAAQIIAFGPDFDTPRFVIDTVGDEVYGLDSTGTVKTFQLSLQTGRLQSRNAAGNVLFDTVSAGAGQQRFGGTSSYTGRSLTPNTSTDFILSPAPIIPSAENTQDGVQAIVSAEILVTWTTAGTNQVVTRAELVRRVAAGPWAVVQGRFLVSGSEPNGTVKVAPGTYMFFDASPPSGAIEYGLRVTSTVSSDGDCTITVADLGISILQLKSP